MKDQGSKIRLVEECEKLDPEFEQETAEVILPGESFFTCFS